MTSNQLNALRKQNLTNSDLEGIYQGRRIDQWVRRHVVDEYIGPDGWQVAEFTFAHIGSNTGLQGFTFTGRVFYKNCGPDDPYGRSGCVFESTLLGERNYPI